VGIKWKIRNILKDGTVLESTEKLPITEESLEAFKKYGEIALKATAEETTVEISFDEVLCAHYIAKRSGQVAVKNARMSAYSW